VADGVNNRRTGICTESIELLRLGYPEEIESLHIFPMSVQDEHWVLSVFNSRLTDEDCAQS
jgi:hypothetical protein